MSSGCWMKCSLIACNLFFFIGLQVKADCDKYLLDSSELSKPALAYLGLIEHYQQNSSPNASAKVLESISAAANSKAINPFLKNSHETLDIQMHLATQDLIRQIHRADWVRIQSMVAQLNTTWRNQAKDRATRSLQTRYVIRPRTVDQFILERPASVAPAAHNVNGVHYLAVATSPKQAIYLFDVSNGRLKEQQKLPISRTLDSLSWHRSGNRHFLFGMTRWVLGQDSKPWLFELVRGRLERVPISPKILRRVIVASAFAHVNGHDYIVFGGQGELILCELINGELIEVNSRPIFLRHHGHIDNKVRRVSVAVSENRLFIGGTTHLGPFLYEMRGLELVRRIESTSKRYGGMYLGPEMMANQNGQILMAYYSVESNYEQTKLGYINYDIGSQKTFNAAHILANVSEVKTGVAPPSLNPNGSHASLAVAGTMNDDSFDPAVQIYKWENGQLELTFKYPTESKGKIYPSLFSFENRDFVVSESGAGLEIFEASGAQPQRIAELPLDQWLSAAPHAFPVGDRAFIAASAARVLTLIELTSSANAQNPD